MEPGSIWGRDRHGRGNFGALSGAVKSTVSHCCIACCKKINNGITAPAAVDCNAVDWSASLYVKNPTIVMVRLVKILRPLANYYYWVMAMKCCLA